MPKRAGFIRKVIYKMLPFKTYLWVLSKIYFLSYKAGMLKSSDFFGYQYFIKKVVQKGDVCIDIGANLGYFTVPLAKLAGKEGKVYAVEPVKPVLEVLRMNTKGLDNVEILPYALGKENKKIRLGNDSLKAKGYVASGSHYVLENEGDTEEKPEMEFDAEMKKAGELFSKLKRLDFIKCDVEGYEIYIIPELKPLILKYRPVLFVETSGENRAALLEIFSNNDFSPYVLKQGLMHKVRGDEKGDLIIIPSEKEERFSAYIKKG
ncbi:MAG: FkbM family methyltransferase [Bacteroidales bacterium]